MKIKLNSLNDRKIDLSNGGKWDKTRICIFISLIAFFIIVGTSKMWLPDDRINMTHGINDPYFFTRVQVDPLKTLYVDNEKHLGQIIINEERTIGEENKYPLTYKITDDKGNELSHIVSVSAINVTDKERYLGKRKVLLQFAVPKNVYYINVLIEQKDNSTNVISFDYRDFKKKTIYEKGTNYFSFVESEKKTLQDMKENLKKEESKKDKNKIEQLKQDIEKQNLKIKVITKGIE